MKHGLKMALIKLGTTNPELRPHIRPILAGYPYNDGDYGEPETLNETLAVGSSEWRDAKSPRNVADRDEVPCDCHAPVKLYRREYDRHGSTDYFRCMKCNTEWGKYDG